MAFLSALIKQLLLLTHHNVSIDSFITGLLKDLFVIAYIAMTVQI